MKPLYCITLQQRSGACEKIRVSHWLQHEVHAELYLSEVLKNLRFFLKFYPCEEQDFYYNDDFLIGIEPEPKCQDLSFHPDDSSGQGIIDLSVEMMIGFMELV